MTYGTRIKQGREDLRLTQEQLAERLDVSRQAVSKWEADLSRPTREKLDRLSQILSIPPETWAEIDAENAPPAPAPHAARPWKLAAAALAVLCAALAIALFAALRGGPPGADAPRPVEDPPPGEELPFPDGPLAVADPFPGVLPISVSVDFDFGNWPLGDYDPAEVPFLEDEEELREHELWGGSFPDGTRLSLVKARAGWDPIGAHSNLYLLWAPPTEGGPEYRILYRVGEDYTGPDSGDPEAVPFANVLGCSGFKLSLSHAENFYRDSAYLVQGPDGAPRLMTMSGNAGQEADVDEDGALEIVSFNPYMPGWEITDTRDGREGSVTCAVPLRSGDLPDGFFLDFDPEKGGFVVTDGGSEVQCRYVLRQDEGMVRRPLTDFSVLDYPDAAGTKVTFVTDVEILSDGLGPDEFLPYSGEVSITHRQQAYLALQELYGLTGLKVDECCCAANQYGVLFSLLPDGFNQRGFFACDFTTPYGGVEHIPTLSIAWKELGCDWSPLSLEDAVRPDPAIGDAGEALLWYYERMRFFSTGEAARAEDGELWLENGDLYVYFTGDAPGGPVLTAITGPYPGGVVNH